MLRNAFMHFLSRACRAMLSLGTDTAADIGPPQSLFPFPAISISGACKNAVPTESNGNELLRGESGIAMSLRGQIRLFAARRKIASA